MMKERALKTLTHARIDAPHLADGLFVLTQGTKDRGRNRVISTRWCELEITFACVEPLGDAEQSVLLALVARAGIDGKRISASGQSQRGKKLHALLKAEGELSDRDGVCISTTIRAIVRDVGLSDSGSAYAAVEDALRRLGRVTVEIEDASDPNTHRRGNTLLLAYAQDGDHLNFAFNHRIREALKNTGFTRVDLIERRSLPTPTARLLHTFLSRWLRPGNQQTISFEALARHVWANGFRESRHARRGQMDTLRAAMREISGLEAWAVKILDDSCLVQRGHSKQREKRRIEHEKRGASNEKRDARLEWPMERIAA